MLNVPQFADSGEPSTTHRNRFRIGRQRTKQKSISAERESGSKAKSQTATRLISRGARAFSLAELPAKSAYQWQEYQHDEQRDK